MAAPARNKRSSMGESTVVIGTATLTVDESDLSDAVGSGDVPTLATPRIVAMVEQAARDAIRERLRGGQTTVGTYLEMRHTAPTPAGMTVTATVELRRGRGGMMEFAFRVEDQRELVASGTHRRVVVDRDSFIQRAGQKTAAPQDA